MVELCLGDNGIVGAPLEGHDEVVSLDSDIPGGLDELSVELFGFHSRAPLLGAAITIDNSRWPGRSGRRRRAR